MKLDQEVVGESRNEMVAIPFFNSAIGKTTMKTIFQYLFVAFCLITATDPLYAQWIHTSGPEPLCFAVSGTNIFDGADGGVYLSTNNGASWTEVNSGLRYLDVWSLAVSPSETGGTNIFAVASTFNQDSDGVFLSTNDGTNWTAAGDSGFTYPVVINFYALAVSPNGAGGTNLLAGTLRGVFVSTNSGTSWIKVNIGLMSYWVTSFAISPSEAGGTNIFAGTYGSGVFLSTNNGTGWTQVNSGLTDTTVNALAVSGTNLFAGTRSGVFLSTNKGTSWTEVDSGLTNSYVNALAVSGTNLFAGTYSGGVLLSTNNGTTWTQVNTGLTETYITAFAVTDTNLFAGTNGGVWRRPLSEMITGIEKPNGNIPARFSLSQNYPNPFNPSTKIIYQLPINIFVTLKVYDVLGREVKTLVNEWENVGIHSVTFDASNLPSGAYFCRLEARTYHDVEKLLLLK